MSNIMIFTIPAWGHTNPLLEVTAALVRKGHSIRFYSFQEFASRIQETGAEFVSCDAYLPELTKKQEKKLKQVSTTQMSLNAFKTTELMTDMLAEEIKIYKPDLIISDSVCFWGKLTAQKYHIPLICSTTTMAFNEKSSRYLKYSGKEIADMIFGQPRLNMAARYLIQKGYPIHSALDIVKNDNSQDTIVYTTKTFQPFAESFSDRYLFAGVSVKKTEIRRKPDQKKIVYISLGTVVNERANFYHKCIQAFSGKDLDVIISCGQHTDLSAFGKLPENIKVFPHVDQLDILAEANAFLTHCGMNSVQESLYMSVPMILYPQTGEESAVAKRVEELGAGLMLENEEKIYDTVMQVLNTPSYLKAAETLRQDYLNAPGVEGIADYIETRLSAL